MKKIFYPELSNHDFGWFRLSGPGLANCMFFAARAYIYSQLKQGDFISPTWKKLGIGPLIRGEKDKRIYNDLFYNYGISGFRKFAFLLRRKLFKCDNIIPVGGKWDCFEDLKDHYPLVIQYFDKIVKPTTISKVNQDDFSHCIGVHIRRGDYPAHLRVSIDWFQAIISNLQEIAPDRRFLIFSDGKDEELADVLKLKNTHRVFYGNAYADMLALSKCELIVASDSTFSAWGAFLGQKPIIFSTRHFKPMYIEGTIPEIVLGQNTQIPESIRTYLQFIK